MPDSNDALVISAWRPPGSRPEASTVCGGVSPRTRIAALVAQLASRFFSADVASLSLTSRIRFHLGVKDSLLEKFRYCVRLALTTTPVDWEMMHLPEFASSLYLPLRALRLLRKYGGENAQLPAKRRTVGPV